MASSLYFITFLSFSSHAQALTFLEWDGDNSCTTFGDPSIYGPGVRAGFYLQWIASLLALLFAPSQYSGNRVAGIAVLWAVLISSINSALTNDIDPDDGTAVPVFEWTIVSYLVIGLFGANIPIGKTQMAQTAGAWVAATFAGCVTWGAIFHLYWTPLHDMGNLRDVPNFSQVSGPSCEVHVALLAPINAFSNGWITFNKVISIIACFIYIPLFVIFAARLLHFNLKYGGYDSNEVQTSKPSNMMRYVIAVVLFISGIISIVSVEVMISTQKVMFNNLGFIPTVGGQKVVQDNDVNFFSVTSGLASLIMGLVCFFTVLWEIPRGKYGNGIGMGNAPPPPDFWSAGSALKMVRLRR